MYMKNALFIFIASLLLVSCSSSIDGDGPATAQRDYTADKVINLTVNCNCNVTLVPGNKVGIKVETHQNLIDNLKVEAKNGVLKIAESSSVNQFSAYDIYIYITRDLKEITLNKQTNLKVSGTLNVDGLTITANDQSKIAQSYIITNNIKLNTNDQSVVALEGTALSMRLRAYGQSKSDLLKYEINDVEFITDDNALVDVNVRKSLVGTAKGSSILVYLNEPFKDTKVADKAQIVKK